MSHEDTIATDMDSEDDPLKAEVDELLSSWGVNSDNPRKRKASVKFEPARAYPGFQFADCVRHQHLVNLVACMRHFEAIRDDASLAAVLATLLQAEVRIVFITVQLFRNPF